jgi:hypothetical protein
MAGTSYDAPVEATGCDVVTRVATPAVATSPRGLLSVATIIDDQDPVRWGVTGALYENLAAFDAATPEGFGVYEMDCDDFCPSPTAGTSANLTLNRATAYTAWSRIACTGPQTDALDYARSQYAIREERLMESILAGIVAGVTETALGTDVPVGVGQLESDFAKLYAGQGTLWLNSYSVNVLAAANLLLSGPNNSLLTAAGNRVAVSPVFDPTLPVFMTPNLTIHRSSLDVLDFFNRATNMQDALAQRQYLFVIDPAADMVSGTFSE